MRAAQIGAWLGVTLALTLAVLVSACSGSESDAGSPPASPAGAAQPASADKAGGNAGAEATGPIRLTMASPIRGGQPEQLQSFADDVERLSAGSLLIEFEPDWRPGDPAFEAHTIDDVKAGKVDLAWVGARAFDTLGVNDFQPLVAPFVVDSHDVQQRVFEAGIPQEMLAGVERLGIEGLGVLPGPMRALLGISHAFTTPGDFVGVVVGIQDSEVATETFEALGATARPVPSQAPLDGLDAYEQQLGSIVSNGYAEGGVDSITGGLNLWPRPLVLFTSPSLLQRLSPAQREVLRQAAAEAVPAALAASREEDAAAAAELCGAGVGSPRPTRADRAALEAAVQPVVDRIAADPAAAGFLERIAAIRDALGTTVPAGPGCVDEAPAEEPTLSADTSAVDGVYTTEVSRREWIDAVGLTGADVPSALGDLGLTLRIADGRWRVEEAPEGWALVGVARLDGDTLELASHDGQPAWRLIWSRYRDTLELEPEAGSDAPYWLGLNGWLRTGDADPTSIDPDLGPPAEPRDGVFRRTITQAELLRAGIPPGEESNYAGTFEFAFSDGTVEAGPVGGEMDSMRVRVDGDLLRFEWAEDGEWMGSYSSSLENGALRLLEFHGFGSDLGLIGWVGGPWKKVG
jgi:TRAP-type C4-dicarboxylate transport system substrate-binding protein